VELGQRNTLLLLDGRVGNRRNGRGVPRVLHISMNRHSTIDVSEFPRLVRQISNYEALTKETINPDPSLLFELYLLHPRIKAITRSLFHKGEYFSAVFEATKALNDFLRERTGSRDSETTLVRNVFGDPASREIRDPKIKFNPLDPASPDYRSQQNEQRGMSNLAHGVFFAFRHPKGHEPQDTQWGDITAYEALDQLIVISYLMKRIVEAR